MKSPLPISAAGWISTPVTARLTAASAPGSTGTPAPRSACATRCARSACTPGHSTRTSSEETPRAAGSRWWTAATSRRISAATRPTVLSPSIAGKRSGPRRASVAWRGTKAHRSTTGTGSTPSRVLDPGRSRRRLPPTDTRPAVEARVPGRAPPESANAASHSATRRSAAPVARGRGEEGRRDVALAGVRQDGDDALAARLRPAGDLQRAPDRRAARHAGEHALAPGQRPGQPDRLLVGAPHHLVQQFHVQDGRHESGADALDPMRPCRSAGQDGRLGGLHRDDLRPGVALLEHLADAGDRPTRADARHEHVDAAVHVAQDLHCRRARVDLGVGRVRELVGQEGVVAGGQRARGVDGLVHAAERLDDLDLGAVQAQERLALAAHPLREEDHEVVALGRAAEGQRDAGVARCGLDDRGAPRLDAPLALGGLDHRHADAVLDRAARVEGLELAVELDVEAGGQDPRQAQERRAPDVLGNVDRDSAHPRSSVPPARGVTADATDGARARAAPYTKRRGSTLTTPSTPAVRSGARACASLIVQAITAPPRARTSATSGSSTRRWEAISAS